MPVAWIFELGEAAALAADEMLEAACWRSIASRRCGPSSAGATCGMRGGLQEQPPAGVVGMAAELAALRLEAAQPRQRACHVGIGGHVVPDFHVLRAARGTLRRFAAQSGLVHDHLGRGDVDVALLLGGGDFRGVASWSSRRRPIPREARPRARRRRGGSAARPPRRGESKTSPATAPGAGASSPAAAGADSGAGAAAAAGRPRRRRPARRARWKASAMSERGGRSVSR